MEFHHSPIMLKEVIENLHIKADGIYVDGTLGGGGHSYEILKKLSRTGKLIGVDKDQDAIKAAKEKLKDFSNVTYVQGNHDEIKSILQEQGISKVDGILLDLGVSSYQIDEAARGFSYMGAATLDMRMDQSGKLTAKDVVNNYSEEKLRKILYEYGEEKFAGKIVKEILLARKKETIETTKELARIIEKAVPKQKNGHPAKRTFQAIRIEVNNEIHPLYQTIKDSIACLQKEGRLCVITFHSLEDRQVKQAMQDSLGICVCPKNIPYCVCKPKKEGTLVTRKPIIPSKEEISTNPRSASSKLRIFEKGGE